MKSRLLCFLTFALASHVALAVDGITFGPVRAQPGQSVRLTSLSESREGVIELTKAGKKDPEKAQLIGTMRLRQIRRTATKDVAVMDVAVRGSGGDFQADGSEQNARIELKGQMTVDLKTMLDESLELNGVLETRSGRASESRKANLPIRLVVNKTFAKGVSF